MNRLHSGLALGVAVAASLAAGIPAATASGVPTATQAGAVKDRSALGLGSDEQLVRREVHGR